MPAQKNQIEIKAAQLAERPLEWNELDFVGWKEFRRMAPAVVGLEIARIERLTASVGPEAPAYNALIRARFNMRSFVDRLTEVSRPPIDELSDYLAGALIALALVEIEEAGETLRYTCHRLKYVHDRLQLVY